MDWNWVKGKRSLEAKKELKEERVRKRACTKEFVDRSIAEGGTIQYSKGLLETFLSSRGFRTERKLDRRRLMSVLEGLSSDAAVEPGRRARAGEMLRVWQEEVRREEEKEHAEKRACTAEFVQTSIAGSGSIQYSLALLEKALTERGLEVDKGWDKRTLVEVLEQMKGDESLEASKRHRAETMLEMVYEETRQRTQVSEPESYPMLWRKS